MENEYKYFRLVAYHEATDRCAIIDCYGAYKQLWQFSAYVKSAGLKILEVGSEDKFLDVNMKREKIDLERIIIVAEMPGKPIYRIIEQNGKKYRAVIVEEKMYIPDRNKTE